MMTEELLAICVVIVVAFVVFFGLLVVTTVVVTTVMNSQMPSEEYCHEWNGTLSANPAQSGYWCFHNETTGWHLNESAAWVLESRVL